MYLNFWRLFYVMNTTTKYELFKNIIDIPDHISRYIRVESKKGDPIFNDVVDGSIGDGKRIQSDFNCEIGRYFKRKLRSFIKNKGLVHHVIRDLVIVRSEPFCKRQKLHYDYDTDVLRKLQTKDYPHGLIVAVSDHSRFIVNGSGKNTTVHLNKGDVLVFRGDLLHAGAEYYNENIRLHAYIDSKKYTRDKNITYIA